MKIALFTDTYDEVNGVTNTFHYLVKYCSRNNKQLHVYAHATNGEDSVEDLGSAKIFRYKSTIPIDVYFGMQFDLKVPRFRIFDRCKEEDYDLIHTATPGSMGLNALIVAHFQRVPLIGSYHTALPEYVKTRVEKIVEAFRLPTKRSPQRLEARTWDYMKWYYNQCKLVLAPSRHTKAELEKKLRTDIGIFSRGIDTERFHPEYREERKGTIVLYVGRVSLEKNLDLLAEIFEDRNDAQLVIVGGGPYSQEMQQNLPTATFRGFLDGEELSAAYASADIFAFPSTSDTFGNVVLEAMSSGLPVVVTDKMGPKELVNDGENGFIAHGKHGFAQKLDMLINDAKLRKEIGRKARVYAESQSWDTVFDKLFEDYEGLLEE